MTLKERLMVDMKTSMKNKDKVRKNAITMVRAAIKQREVDERIELTDEDIIQLMSKQVKQKRDAIEDFRKGNRDDLVGLTEKEISILMEYLPRQLDESEIDALVKEAINTVGANTKKDIGKVMSCIMPKVQGRADGSKINRIVMKYLK